MQMVREIMSKRVTALLVILSGIIVVGSIVVFYKISSATRPCPLPDYTSYHGYPEDLLILEGSCVVPTAIEAVRDRTLPKRPFVISFLGNGSYQDALEALTNIVEDETDPDRSPAIIAVFQINEDRGRELARKYQSEEDDLGSYSRDIIAGKDYLYKRKSYWGALRSYISVEYAL
jgi:hypothetical protein